MHFVHTGAARVRLNFKGVPAKTGSYAVRVGPINPNNLDEGFKVIIDVPTTLQKFNEAFFTLPDGSRQGLEVLPHPRHADFVELDFVVPPRIVPAPAATDDTNKPAPSDEQEPKKDGPPEGK